MTDYLKLAQETPEAPAADPGNPYLDLAKQDQAAAEARTRTVLEMALKDKPDVAAERQRLAKSAGLPLPVVERNLEQVRLKEQARQIDLIRMAQDSPVLMRQLGDPTFTTTAIDDLDTLTQIEKSVGNAVRYMMGAAPGGGITGDLKASLFRSSAAAAGVQRAAVDVIEPWARLVAGDDNWFKGVSDWLTAQGKAANATADRMAPATGGNVGKGVSSGVQSFAMNAKYLPLAALGPAGAVGALGAMVAESFGTSYNKAADANLPLWQSLGYASADAMVEYWTEKLPLDALIGGIKQGAPFIKVLGKQMALEIPGEQLATTLQDLNEWAVLNPGKPFTGYLAERPDAMVQTLIATVIGTGGNVMVTSGVGKVADSLYGTQWRDNVTTSYQAMLDEQLKLAGGSLLRERSPEQFRAHVQAVVDQNEGAPASIHVDGEVLNQLPEELKAQLPQGVRDQIEQAAATGDTVEIPMADVLTLAPGTPLKQVLNEHARMDPFAQSMADVKMAASQAQELLKQEAERVIQQASDQEAMRASSDAVKASIQSELGAAGRFRPAVNEGLATWATAFYTTMAARTGMTPEQFYAKHRLRILGAPSAGGQQVMDQVTPEQALETNVPVEMPTAPEFIEAVGNTAGARVTPDGLLLDLVRFQKEEQEGAQAIRTGVFYLPKGSANAKHYRVTPTTKSPNAYGGSERMDGQTLIRRPLFVKGGTGGKAPEAAYDAVKGKGAMKALDSAVMAVVTSRGVLTRTDPSLFRENVEQFLRDNGGEPGLAYEIIQNSKQGNTLRYALQEHVIAHAVRSAGYDAVIGYTKGKAGAGIAEVFDVREQTYPARGMDSQVHDAYAQSVSTRVPTAKKATEDAVRDIIDVGLESSMADPAAFAKNVALVTGYPNYLPSKAAKTDKQKAERFIAHVVDNLLYLHDQMPAATRARAKLWYDGARKITDRWVNKYGYTASQIAGVLAVQSPQKDWFMNVTLAERILDALRFRQDFAWSPEMTETGARIWGKEQYQQDLAEIQGKTLAELQSPVHKAMWIRTFDQAHNERSYRLVTPEGGFGEYVQTQKGESAKVAWATVDGIAKAVRVIEDGSLASISDNLGQQHKVRNFNNNIYDPADPRGPVTIDTHAVAAALLQPLSGNSPEVGQNFGGAGSASSSITGSQGTYGLYAEAYRRAAEQRGVLPREMQSITWEAVRGLFTAGFKSQEKNVAAVQAVWENYRAKKVTLDEARTQLIALAGGVNPPDWIESPAGTHEGAGDGSYASQFPRPELAGRGAGPADTRDGGGDAAGVSAADAVLEQQAATRRGTFNPRSLELVLNPNANLSTFFHETGHFFLEVMADIASQPGAPARIVEDMGTFLKWAGVKDLATWNALDLDGKRKYHERWAESVEQYVMEGRAPSVELQPLMRRFATWLKSVYGSIQKMLQSRGAEGDPVQLNDDIRRVMDRMLATDEQIAQANEVAGLVPDVDADATAAERLNKRSMRDLALSVKARDNAIKDLRKEAKILRDAIEQRVTEEVDAMPVYQAKAALDRLMAASPEHKADLAAHKELRKAAEVAARDEVKAALLGENPETKGIFIGQLLMKNKRDIDNKVDAAMIKWDAANPKPQRVTPDMTPQMESIATQFEYSSVDQMLQDIAAASPRREAIEGMTDQGMLEEHGDLVDERAIQQAANEAVHNDARARSLATELRTQGEMLNKREDTGETNKRGARITVNALVEAAKQFGANVVARTTIRDMRGKAWQHTAAERRAGAAWQKATAAGKTAEAVKAKQDQMLNNAAAKAALEAETKVRGLLDYLKKFDKAGVREKLPIEYLDQIDKLLERIDLRVSTTGRDIDRRASLAKWIESQHAIGLDPVLPENLLEDIKLKSYKEMTFDEFVELTESIKNIEHLGRLKSKLLAAKDKREFTIIAEEIQASIIANGGKPRPVQLEPDGRIKAFFKGAWADHRKLNSLVRQMDGGVDNGPFYRALVRSMNDAGAAENVMLEKATEALAKIYAPIEKLKGGISGDKRFIPEINNSLTRAGRLSVALNWGNPQNRQRVMDGDAWTEAQVDAILATLTPVELQFVNNVWEHIDSYWPEVKAKQERVSGVAEDKVAAVPFEINGVQMRGGYYPIKYDGDRSVKAEKQEAMEAAAEIMRGAVARPTTRRGHTKARVDEVKGRPVKKDLSVITQHVNQVVHDLAWHEWFIDANRLLNDPRILGAIRDHHGPEIARTMMDTANAIAVGDATRQGQIDRLLLMMRSNVTRSIMGASLTTALLQPFGLTQSMARVGVVPVLKGAGRWAGDAVHMVSTIGWINSKSGFMRLRSKTFNRELREISQRVRGKSKFMQVADASLFFLMQKLQMVADVPTWVGAYEKALAGGVDESAAVALADEAVLGSQGGGTTKDLAAVQRNMPFLTQFYSYFNTTLNLVAEKTALTDFKNPRAAAGWLGDMALLAVIPAILPALITYLLKGGGEDDDAEDWAKKLLEWQAGYLLGMFVGLRELPTLWSPFDYGGPPAAKLLNDGKKLVQQAGQGEIDDPAVLATIGFLGTALGIPTTQIIRSYKGWLAWDEGDAPPTSILFGPPPKN